MERIDMAHPNPPKRRRKWPWIAAAALLAIIVIAAMSSGDSGSPGAGGDTAQVVYEVDGADQAGNISYAADGTGSIAQDNNVPLPWRKEITVQRGFAIVTLTAQNAGAGTITCRIIVDGQVVRELSSQGEYAVVSCTADPIT
jgi:hypothetical protein